MTEYGSCPAFGYQCEYVAKVEAQAAEIEKLRRCIRDCPTRADYSSAESFVDAHRNWEFHHVRAALGETK